MSQTADSDFCPLAEAALLLNSKWDLIVIYNLLEEPLRFTQLKQKISEGIPTSITSSSLTRILRKLEASNILERDVTADVGESLEVTYQLTDMGRALAPTIESLKSWSTTYL